MTTLTGETLARATDKLQRIIDTGRQQAEAALAKIRDEAPADAIVPTSSITYGYRESEGREGGALHMGFRADGGDPDYHPIHDFALGQVCDKAGLPRKWMETLHREGDWGQQLIAHDLNVIYSHRPRSKHLVRSVGGEVRGFLSDRYLRLDTPQLVEAFASAAGKYGLVPIEATAMPTKFVLKAALPQVIEPFPGEPVVFGMSIHNSDFGDGAFELRMFAMRVWCTNLAVGEDGLRRVHLGSRLSGDIAVSQRTYELDNKALASATTDVVSGMFEPERVRARVGAIAAAASTKVDIKGVLDAARKSGTMNIGEAKSVTDIYNAGGIELLPPGDNAWRLSNAISYFAQSVQPERKLDLEILAGKVAGLHLES